jgi:hypothetical protein
VKREKTDKWKERNMRERTIAAKERKEHKGKDRKMIDSNID